MKQHNIRIILAFTAIYVIWGSTYLAIRYAIETIPPLMMIGVRSLTAGIILYIFSRYKSNEKIKRENIMPLVTIGALFFLIGHGLVAWAQQYVPSGMAAVLVSAEPLWIIGIEWFFLRDIRVKGRGVSGLFLGFAGIVYLILTSSDITTSGNNFLASVLIVVATLSWGGGAVYSRVAKVPKSPILSSGMELIFGGIMVLIVSFIIGESSHFQLSQVSLKSFLALLYLITFGSVIAFSAYTWLLGHTSATRISTHTFVNPIIAVFLGWLIADEQINSALLVATAIIIISVYLVLYDQYQGRKGTGGRGRILLSFFGVFLFFSCTSNQKPKSLTVIKDLNGISIIKYSVTKTYPHSTNSYTEGLIFNNDELYESTGSPDNYPHTRSVIGPLNLRTGEIEVKVELDRNRYFGEGIVFLNDKLFQLTYKNQIGFIYDARDFKQVGSFSYKNKEGWGMTTDGHYIIMSDGTNYLYYWDPDSLTEIKRINVTYNGSSALYANELEYINGFIYANIWTTNFIAKIDPADGKIVGLIDLTNLFLIARKENPLSEATNGIAYNSKKDKVFVTGKFWPYIFEIKFLD